MKLKYSLDIIKDTFTIKGLNRRDCINNIAKRWGRFYQFFWIRDEKTNKKIRYEIKTKYYSKKLK